MVFSLRIMEAKRKRVDQSDWSVDSRGESKDWPVCLPKGRQSFALWEATDAKSGLELP